MFAAFGRRSRCTSITFVSQAAFAGKVHETLGLPKEIEPVRRCRDIGKKDMIHNDRTPRIEVDPETYAVSVDGEPITCEPAKILPMAQRYFMF